MLKKMLFASAAIATLGVPAAADAQYYGRTYGAYGHDHHYYWDGRHYRDRDNNAVLDTVIGGLLGYAVGSMSNRSYGYSYPSSAYGYSYGYPSGAYGYQYSYPGYSSSYSSYGYSYPGYGYSSPAYGYSYPGYGYDAYGYGYYPRY